MSFGFCLVNFECDACVTVDHSLVDSHPKTPRPTNVRLYAFCNRKSVDVYSIAVYVNYSEKYALCLRNF